MAGGTLYRTEGYQKVEGWLQASVLWALDQIAAYHEEHHIRGKICEIGVHHGRFFLALENVARPDEECIAIDVFDDQTFNVDRSGFGSLETFTGNLDRYALNKDRVTIKTWDSTSYETRKFFAACGPIRLFSVDGGHTPQHVIADMRNAEASLADGGVIFADDFFNADFPSVNEGLRLYLAHSALVPVVTTGGKLLLTGISHHRLYLAHFKRVLESSEYRAKIVRWNGVDFFSIAKKRA